MRTANAPRAPLAGSASARPPLHICSTFAHHSASQPGQFGLFWEMHHGNPFHAFHFFRP